MIARKSPLPSFMHFAPILICLFFVVKASATDFDWTLKNLFPSGVKVDPSAIDVGLGGNFRIFGTSAGQTVTAKQSGRDVIWSYRNSPLSCAEVEEIADDWGKSAAGQAYGRELNLLDCGSGDEGNDDRYEDFEATGLWKIRFVPEEGSSRSNAQEAAVDYYEYYRDEFERVNYTWVRVNSPQRDGDAYVAKWEVDASNFGERSYLEGGSSEWGSLYIYCFVSEDNQNLYPELNVRLEPTTSDALFHPVVLDKDWLWSPWIGIFYLSGKCYDDLWPWIYVEATDSFWWIDRSSDNKGVSYYDSRDRAWKWVSPESSPDVYNFDLKSWEAGELN